MSAPVQGTGGGSGGGLNPAMYVGTYSGTNPSSPANGAWWYRVDTGQLWMNVNGTIMPIRSIGFVTVIGSNTTIANTDVYNNIVVLSGATLTIYGNVVFHNNLTILNGGTLLSSNPSASSSSTQTNNYQFLGNFYLNGTYSIAQYNVDNINTSITISTVTSASGSNPTISISGTLLINQNITLSVPISGSGTLSIPSGYTATIGASVTCSVSSISVSGTFTISANATISSSNVSISGTLTINSNATISSSNVSGSGTLSISSGYTLTQSGTMTLSVSTVTISGTWSQSANITITTNISVSGAWAANGYGITIPSGTTISWKTTGSLSGGGTLTINGMLYYYGISLSYSTSEISVPSFPLSLAGSGIGLFTGTGSHGGYAYNFGSTTLSAGSNSSFDGSGTPAYPGIYLSSVSGSAVGNYGLEVYWGNPAYDGVMLIYIGTANNTYSVNFTGAAPVEDSYTFYVYVRNNSGSAGSLTIAGTLYA